MKYFYKLIIIGSIHFLAYPQENDDDFERQCSLANAYRYRTIEPIYDQDTAQCSLRYKNYHDNTKVYEQLCEQAYSDFIAFKYKITKNRAIYDTQGDERQKKLINFFSLFWKKNADIDMAINAINENNDDQHCTNLKEGFENYYKKQLLSRASLSKESLQKIMRLQLIKNRIEFAYAFSTNNYHSLKQMLAKPLFISNFLYK